jgi:hypothetical protein
MYNSKSCTNPTNWYTQYNNISVPVIVANYTGNVESRKKIYMPQYIKMARKTKEFAKLKKMLKDGKNLLIIEVDGPHQETMDYYREKYDVPDDFIVGSTILVNDKNMNIMLNDPKHPFGHGYCLGWALLK